MSRDWRSYGALSPAIWRDELGAAGSPMFATRDAILAAAGEDSALMAAMCDIESRYATRFRHNVAGNRNPLNLRPRDGGDGYLAFPSYVACVQEWRARLRDPAYAYAGTVTLADLIAVYAPASDANDPHQYVSLILDRFARWGVGQEHPMATKPTVLVIAGHRSYHDAGNPNEKALTPALARAYRDAFRAAGYACQWLQEIDGDPDPDDTAGGLDTVSAKAAAWIARQPGECILLDLHYEGSPARGCFAIIPDVTGLRTAVAVPQDPADTWENNVLDRALGRAIVDGISTRTGLPLRQGIREPGLMDESQTGVGGQGWRLATFAYTSPYRDNAVRLVIEHGNHTHPQDAAIIARPGFPERCAAAAVDAVTAVSGEPKYATPNPVPWPRGDVGYTTLGAAKAYKITAELTCARETQPRKYASGKSERTGPKIKVGQKVVVIGTLSVQNGKRVERWLIREDGSRLTAAAFTPKLPHP